jgi:hypothetical protein
MEFNKPSYGHKSYESALNGISSYVSSKHKDLIPTPKDWGQYKSKLAKLIKKFLKEQSLDYKASGKDSAVDYNANQVQDNFKEFKEWLTEQ